MLRKNSYAESNSADIEVNVQDTENLLTSIKDTDGIRKIADDVTSNLKGYDNASAVWRNLHIRKNAAGDKFALKAALTYLNSVGELEQLEGDPPSDNFPIDLQSLACLSFLMAYNESDNLIHRLRVDNYKSLFTALKNSLGQTINPAKEDGNLQTLLNLFNPYSDGRNIPVDGTSRTIYRGGFDINNTTATVIGADLTTIAHIVGIEFSVDTDGTTLKLVENTVGDIHAAQTFMKGGGKVVGNLKKIMYSATQVNKAIDITVTGGKATGNIWFIRV